MKTASVIITLLYNQTGLKATTLPGSDCELVDGVIQVSCVNGIDVVMIFHCQSQSLSQHELL